MTNDAINRLRARRERIDAQLSKLSSRERTQARRDDTRRKIIAGGVLLAAVARDATLEKPTGIARWWRDRLREIARPQDRRLFEPLSAAQRPTTEPNGNAAE